MPIIPTHQEILEELEQFERDYPDREEFLEILADYIEQVADEAAGGASRV